MCWVGAAGMCHVRGFFQACISDTCFTTRTNCNFVRTWKCFNIAALGSSSLAASCKQTTSHYDTPTGENEPLNTVISKGEPACRR